MKNKATIYLAYNETKDEIELSATLKKVAIADFLGEATLERDERGKPIITDPQGYYISVSHSANMCSVALATTPVGVDLECVRPRDYTAFAEKFFPEEEQGGDFFDLWVKKEAFGKLLGDGVYSQKGKPLPQDIIFYDFKKEVSALAKKEFSATLALRVSADVSIIIRSDI